MAIDKTPGRARAAFVSIAMTIGLVCGMVAVPVPASAVTGSAWPLHTSGTDTSIYDAANKPIRLVGFNWSGTDVGGRADFQKAADVCGLVWRTPTDSIGGLAARYDDMYSRLASWGYNTIRLPVSWNNLEPVAPTWDGSKYVHSWNPNYLADLKSMVSKAHAAGLMVILDMHQDYWSPALHHITNWDGTAGYCEGIGMPRWLDPSIDAKATTQQSTDFYNAMNWFYRNVHDPAATVTNATPWELFSAAWDQLGFQFSAASGYADYQAVVGVDILNEPYQSYVGGSPPAGQTILQAAGSRLLAFYNAVAPAITDRDPNWLLFFQDGSGGYNIANPLSRETPTMTGKPTAAGNWVYSFHDYNFSYETFSDGVPRHDDFGITLADTMLGNARSWHVPLYIGEFTNFTFGSAANQTDSTMAETDKFLAWAKTNRANWTFWAYVNPYLQMTLVDPATNQPYAVIKNHLATGLDASNQSPNAAFTQSCADLACSFNGSGSADPDGTVTSYAWAFGDGSTGTGVTPSHTYQAAGTYTVTLTVTDNSGATGTISQSVSASAGASYAADTFTRTVNNGWGNADIGGGWTATSPSTCSVGGGVGRVTLTPGTGPSLYLASVNATDTDVQVTASTDKAGTGSGAYLYVIGRRIAGHGDYRAKVRLLASGQVAITLLRVDAAGAETALKAETIVTGLTYTAGTTLSIRLQVTGVGTTTLRAKVWRSPGTEPATWNQTGSDTSGGLQAGGGIGLMAYLSRSATNAPVVVRFDDLRATPSRTP